MKGGKGRLKFHGLISSDAALGRIPTGGAAHAALPDSTEVEATFASAQPAHDGWLPKVISRFPVGDLPGAGMGAEHGELGNVLLCGRSPVEGSG